MHSFAPAPTSGDDRESGRDEPADGLEQLPAQVPLEELQRRAGIKFSGATGAVVSSGGTVVTTAPTYGLVDSVIQVVEGLPPELFNRWAEHRPCGLLDMRSAYGMLICDVHGLPLLPYTLAEPIGKTALKRKGEIAGEQSKAKKKARRNGADPEKAAADVLRRPVALVLPTPAEIAAAWRLLAKADAQPPAAEPPAADPPAADQPTVDPPDPRRVRAMECMFGSQVALDAIDAAYECERHERDLLEAEWGFLDEFDEPLDKEPILDELQVARVRYAQALRKLKAAFPEELNDCSSEGTCEHRRPCPCGRGVRGAWPWVVQTPALGFCEQSEVTLHEFTPRGLWSCEELHEERERWRWALQWSSEAYRAKRLPNGQRNIDERKYREQYESLRRELYCLP